jgi:hypothetical protein
MTTAHWLVDRLQGYSKRVTFDWKGGSGMAARDRSGGGIGGISLGGILVIIGIVLMIVWSFWVGLIILLVGLIAFGGFARGKWY